MENESLSRFAAAVAANPQLQDRLRAIQSQARGNAAEEIAAVASEQGYAFTAEEYLWFGNQAEGMTDEQLDVVAGGRNIMLSIYTDARECWSN
jgi:predicted ribosomally synthesized peptide with nif11-like leader